MRWPETTFNDGGFGLGGFVEEGKEDEFTMTVRLGGEEGEREEEEVWWMQASQRLLGGDC